MRGGGEVGLKGGNKMTSHMTMYCKDNTSKQGAIVSLLVFHSIEVVFHNRITHMLV